VLKGEKNHRFDRDKHEKKRNRVLFLLESEYQGSKNPSFSFLSVFKKRNKVRLGEKVFRKRQETLSLVFFEIGKKTK